MSELEKKVTLKPIKTFRHGAIAMAILTRILTKQHALSLHRLHSSD